MKSIPLRRRGGEVVSHALVDDGDFAVLGHFHWHLSGGYAARKVTVRGRLLTVFMHRTILGLDAGDIRQADHVNRDRLDNRRRNLRVVSLAENLQNVGGHGGNLYRGVYRKRDRWQAVCTLDGKRHYLGGYATQEEAALVASDWRRRNVPFSTEALENTRAASASPVRASAEAATGGQA